MAVDQLTETMAIGVMAAAGIVGARSVISLWRSPRAWRVRMWIQTGRWR